MKINIIKNINFGKTFYGIDMHAHDKSIDAVNQYPNPNDITRFINKPIQLGQDEFVLKQVIPSSLSGIMYKEENGIKKPYINEWEANKGIIETYKNSLINKFYAVCQPKETNGNPQTIAKLLEEDSNKKFIGLKFHPKFSELEATSSLYDAYLDLAAKKDIPCLFHSDRTFDAKYPYVENGKNLVSVVKRCEYSRPEQIYELAKRHPQVPIIMGHLGGPEANDVKTAIDIIIDSADKNNAKLYADFSWVDADNATKPNLIEAINRLKNREQGSLLDRLLFGSDMPIDRFKGEQAENNYKKLITDVHGAVKNAFGQEADDLLDKIFFKNSENLFMSKGELPPTEPFNNGNTAKSSKLLTCFMAGVLILGATFVGIKYFRQNNQNNNNNVSTPNK